MTPLDSKQLSELLGRAPYRTDSQTRRAELLVLMRQLVAHHMEHCEPYSIFCSKRGIKPETISSLEDIPYLSASLFKSVLLLSIPPEQVFREIRSSATTSGQPSRIGLDKENTLRWSRSMQRMLLDRIGNERLRTMVLDDPSALGRSGTISARSSMTRSLLFTSGEVDTCLESDGDHLRLQGEKLKGFLASAVDGKGCMLFGFTFILYMYVVRPLLDSGETFHLPKLKILHAGGWKKLRGLSVSPEQLVADCCRVFGVSPSDVVDIYGFSEQGGLLYPTCEKGVRHTPAWSEVICRDPLTLEPLPPGREGLMQFITPIQTSYPGHSIITEDTGMILGHDCCSCGRSGTVFKISGRAQDSTEERGCGDIMADLFS